MVVLFIPIHLGLNNIPICNVNDDENAFRTWCGVGQLNPSEKGETPFAKCSYPPSTVALESPGRGVSPAPNKVQVPPRPHSGESLSTHEISPEASCKLSGGKMYIIAHIAAVIFKKS